MAMNARWQLPDGLLGGGRSIALDERPKRYSAARFEQL